jgi:hypothetical protein
MPFQQKEHIKNILSSATVPSPAITGGRANFIRDKIALSDRRMKEGYRDHQS